MPIIMGPWLLELILARKMTYYFYNSSEPNDILFQRESMYAYVWCMKEYMTAE